MADYTRSKAICQHPYSPNNNTFNENLLLMINVSFISFRQKAPCLRIIACFKTLLNHRHQ